MENENVIYGVFNVYTESKVAGLEDREVSLGMYEGYVDEIAFALADKCNKTLTFKPVDFKLKDNAPKKKSVHIMIDCLGYEDILNMSEEELLAYYQNLFVDRDVVVTGGLYATSCTITTNAETLEDKKLVALSKLTEEEKKLLNLI